MANGTISWNRLIGLMSAFGIPFISAAAWVLMSITDLSKDVHSLSEKQTKTDARLDLLDNKLDRINNRLDTLAFHQGRIGLFQQQIINGQRVFVPVN